MTSNPEPIVQQVQDEFQNLLTYVTGPDARSQTAYTVELTLFRRLLALGAVLLRLFLVTRAAVRPPEPVTTPEGTRLTDHDQRPTTYYSVFGNVRFARHDFTAPGQEGLCPLDAELSWPARGYSDLLREWAVYGTTDESSRESQTVLERILGRSLSVQALETGVSQAGEHVTTFYEQPADPTAPVPAGTILVVQADGKGVPMVPPPTQTPPVRLGKGQKRGKKKEAVVHGLLHDCPLAAYPPGGGGCPAPGSRPPGASAPPTPRRQGAAGHFGGKGSGHAPSGAAGRPARRAPHPAARGPHRWRRGAATAVGGSLSGVHLGPGHHPCRRVSVGHGQRPAGGDSSAAHGVGPRLPGGAAGGTDRRRHHGVRGRGQRPYVHGDPTPGRTAHDRLLPAQPPVYVL